MAELIPRGRLTRLFNEFFESERASGVVLLSATLLSLAFANSPLGTQFLAFWRLPLGWDLPGLHLRHDLLYWINDGLMAVFFLLIGLEIERELYVGELSRPQNAILPVFAAVGGMLAPALIYLALNLGKPTRQGFGIPMATDIAFSLGVLSLLGRRVPSSVKVFLAAFAIMDDLGAMLVIALFYAQGISLLYLGLAMLVFALLVFMNRRGVNSISAYLLPGLLMWYFMLQSGVHATIAGVLLAFALPFRDGGTSSPSHRVEHVLNRPVALGIMPLFALANTGVVISADLFGSLFSTHTTGIFTGLLLGKPLGIIVFTLLATRTGLAHLPGGVHKKELLGIGFLGGIGFTMSLFVTILAFGESVQAQSAKLAIMLASLLAGLMGAWILGSSQPRKFYHTLRKRLQHLPQRHRHHPHHHTEARD